MAKDGTNRGGRRPRSGEKPTALVEKIAKGKPTKKMDVGEFPDITLLVGDEIGDGADLIGEEMPNPSDYLSAKQKDGSTLGAEESYKETWLWPKERGCEKFISPKTITLKSFVFETCFNG